jgi:hypothetical protein
MTLRDAKARMAEKHTHALHWYTLEQQLHGEGIPEPVPVAISSSGRFCIASATSVSAEGGGASGSGSFCN